jgi:hypothetical protein
VQSFSGRKGVSSDEIESSRRHTTRHTEYYRYFAPQLAISYLPVVLITIGVDQNVYMEITEVKLMIIILSEDAAATK